MDEEKKEFQEELESHNDPVENWSTDKLNKEVNGDKAKDRQREIVKDLDDGQEIM